MLFNQHGDCLAAKLRAGNVSSAEDWDELLLPEIERQQAEGKHVTFRADAAFAKPEIYEALEQRGVDYVIRMPANKNLEWSWRSKIFCSVRRAGRAPSRWCATRASATKPRAGPSPDGSSPRSSLHPGELFARPGFLVTNKALPSRSVVCFYNKRGRTAEQWIKEGKQATSWAHAAVVPSLSSERGAAATERAGLHPGQLVAAGRGPREIGLPSRIKSWSLTTLQHRLMKTGGRLVKHARYYWLLLAEGHLNRRLFGDMLRRLAALPVPGG